MSTVKPKFKAANKSNDRDCHNILKQNFNPKEPNKAWCSDITYIKAGGRFYYLCVIIDLFSRRVIAYKISCKIDTKLVLDTFEFALKNRNYPENVIFHSEVLSIPAMNSEKGWTELPLFSRFLKRGILMTMP